MNALSLSILLVSLTWCTIPNHALLAPTGDPLDVQIQIMDVASLYMGLDNEIQVVVEGVAPTDVEVIPLENIAQITPKAASLYEMRCTQVGKARFEVRDRKTGRTKVLSYPVLRRPNPIVVMGRYRSGLIGAEVMRLQTGLQAGLSGLG